MAVRTSAIRFVFTATAQMNCEFQLQELQLFSTTAEDAKPIAIKHVHSPGGHSPLRQAASMLVDGNIASPWSKYVNMNHATDQQTTLEFGLEALDTQVAAYQLFTANDNPGRDPTAWTVSRLTSDGQWELLQVVTRAVPPPKRHAPYELQVLLPMPPASLDATGLPRFLPAEKHWHHYLAPPLPQPLAPPAPPHVEVLLSPPKPPPPPPPTARPPRRSKPAPTPPTPPPAASGPSTTPALLGSSAAPTPSSVPSPSPSSAAAPCRTFCCLLYTSPSPRDS